MCRFGARLSKGDVWRVEVEGEVEGGGVEVDSKKGRCKGKNGGGQGVLGAKLKGVCHDLTMAGGGMGLVQRMIRRVV